MARFRPAAAPVDADPRPHRAAKLACTILVAALPLTAGCSAAAGRGEPSLAAHHATSSSAAARKANGHNKQRRHATDSPLGPQAVAGAWTAAEEGFYEAALKIDPTLPAYVDRLVPGGPVYQHAVSYLTSLAVQGLIGPALWRVGNVKVLRVQGDSAWLVGCSWDAGSRWKSTGKEAPASLGGGAGYTAYRSIMRREHGSWLVWQTATQSVTNPAEKGPCMHF